MENDGENMKKINLNDLVDTSGLNTDDNDIPNEFMDEMSDLLDRMGGKGYQAVLISGKDHHSVGRCMAGTGVDILALCGIVLDGLADSTGIPISDLGKKLATVCALKEFLTKMGGKHE